MLVGHVIMTTSTLHSYYTQSYYVEPTFQHSQIIIQNKYLLKRVYVISDAARDTGSWVHRDHRNLKTFRKL